MAFISESFLRSLVQENILKPFQITQIKNNIETILSDFINDKNKVAIKQISKSAFLKKYGHLRPGTYEILTRRYDDNSFIDFDQIEYNEIKIKK